MIDDIDAYRMSADRAVDYLRNRPVAHILGSHLELDSEGSLYPFRSQYRPDQHRLELSREDLSALPDALDGFNGFYSRHENSVLTNPTHNLWAAIGGGLAALALIAWGVIWFVRKRRGSRVPAGTEQ